MRYALRRLLRLSVRFGGTFNVAFCFLSIVRHNSGLCLAGSFGDYSEYAFERHDEASGLPPLWLAKTSITHFVGPVP